MKKLLTTLIILLAYIPHASAQDEYNQISPDGNITLRKGGDKNKADSLGTDKEIPQGLMVWTIDRRFGDRTQDTPDTLSHMYMNSIFTTGLRGEFNTTGNLGAPRIHRIFIDRQQEEQFLFTQPYDYFITPVEAFHFTNTLSPITNLSYNTAGNRINGEDHFTAKFGVNHGKRLGVGFKFDYLYGRGYYQNQSTSLFDYTMYGSYLGDRYQAHLLLSTNHQKIAENGGITNDYYITHSERFSDNYTTNEIPTVLEQNWNRNDNQHAFLSHRYNVGFNRKVKMTEEEIKARRFAIASQKENAAQKKQEEERRKAMKEGRSYQDNSQEEFAGRPDNARTVDYVPTDSTQTDDGRIAIHGKAQADSILNRRSQVDQDTMWLKNEYVPVTSFIHTVSFDNYRRIYQAYSTPDNYYANTYYNMGTIYNDSVYDKTRHYALKNTFAIALLEGFNKWAKAGLKAFVSHELRHFTLPDDLGGETSYNEHSVCIGGQLNKTQGQWLHYNVTGEFGIAGDNAGDFSIDAHGDLNLPLFGDTVQVAAKAFVHSNRPVFYMRHYHSRHYWWDNADMDKTFHTRLEGIFSYPKTRTRIRVAVDELKNYTYMGLSYTIADDFSRTGNLVNVVQHHDAISLMTLSLSQDFRLGPLLWENVITFQKSTQEEVIPVPRFNIYSNLFLRFKIARVLSCDLGGDVRYFTRYTAPDYAPGLGLYAVQAGETKQETGNYPIVDVYANFHLKHTRFFVMMSHVNAGSGNKNYFLTPHYPLNERIFRFGVSWNFFN